MGRFEGWPEEAFDVLLQLEGEPTMEERRRLRENRERLVQGHRWNRRLDGYRAAVAGPAGEKLVCILETLQSKGYEISGDVLNRVPRGYPSDHDRAHLLRHRTLTATRHLGCEDWLHTPAACAKVFDALEELRPFMRWLAEHAPSDRDGPPAVR
jgi:hypothetical protein